jgi:hypothetical protein
VRSREGGEPPRIACRAGIRRGCQEAATPVRIKAFSRTLRPTGLALRRTGSAERSVSGHFQRPDSRGSSRSDTLAAKVSGKGAVRVGKGRKVSGNDPGLSDRPPKCPGKASPHWGARFFCPIGALPEWGRAPYNSYGRRTARTGALPAGLAFRPATPDADRHPVPAANTFAARGSIDFRVHGLPAMTNRVTP